MLSVELCAATAAATPGLASRTIKAVAATPAWHRVTGQPRGNLNIATKVASEFRCLEHDFFAAAKVATPKPSW